MLGAEYSAVFYTLIDTAMKVRFKSDDDAGDMPARASASNSTALLAGRTSPTRRPWPWYWVIQATSRARESGWDVSVVMWFYWNLDGKKRSGRPLWFDWPPRDRSSAAAEMAAVGASSSSRQAARLSATWVPAASAGTSGSGNRSGSGSQPVLESGRSPSFAISGL